MQRSSALCSFDLRPFDLRSFVLRPLVLLPFVLRPFVLCFFVPAPFCPALFWWRAFVLHAYVGEPFEIAKSFFKRYSWWSVNRTGGFWIRILWFVNPVSHIITAVKLSEVSSTNVNLAVFQITLVTLPSNDLDFPFILHPFFFA